MNAIAQSPLRVALIGAGMISEFHLRGWQKVPGVEVVAAVDPDPSRAALRKAQFGIPRDYRSLDALFGAEDVDALDIASPRETHGEALSAAARRGIAALCQKPFMPSLHEAEAIVESLGDARVMVNQNFRFRPYYQAMDAWISEGALGAITGCTISCRSSGLLRNAEGKYPYIERQPFVRHEKRMMIEEVLLHRIDIARWLCGPLRLVAARTLHGCAELVGESEATLLFETVERGVPVVIDGNFASAGCTALSEDRIEIIGSKARVTMDKQKLVLHGPAPAETQYEHARVYQQSFDATIAHFVECLRTGRPFLTPPAENLETLRLVEAAYADAARRG